MGTLIVAYDLKKERVGWENDRNKLLAYLQANFDWARLSESSYAIHTPLTPKTVMTSLRQFLDDNDNLYVITLSRPWEWIGAGLYAFSKSPDPPRSVRPSGG